MVPPSVPLLTASVTPAGHPAAGLPAGPLPPRLRPFLRKPATG
jgi:hypothetical protein